MRRRISIRGCVRPSVRPSVRMSRVIFEGEKRLLGASCAEYPALSPSKMAIIVIQK